MSILNLLVLWTFVLLGLILIGNFWIYSLLKDVNSKVDGCNKGGGVLFDKHGGSIGKLSTVDITKPSEKNKQHA